MLASNSFRRLPSLPGGGLLVVLAIVAAMIALAALLPSLLAAPRPAAFNPNWGHLEKTGDGVTFSFGWEQIGTRCLVSASLLAKGISLSQHPDNPGGCNIQGLISNFESFYSEVLKRFREDPEFFRQVLSPVLNAAKTAFYELLGLGAAAAP